jgi:hypothetical protein
MSKHRRSNDEDDTDVQNSIKKLRIAREEDSYQTLMPIPLPMSDLSSVHACENPENSSSSASHLQYMNRLLGTLHTLRVTRKQEKLRAAAPATFTTLSESSNQSNYHPVSDAEEDSMEVCR